MSKAKESAVTPVGRLVQGHPAIPQEKDNEGEPLRIKNGPNAGQLTKKYYMAIAIDKNDPGFAEFHAKMKNVARAGFPDLHPNGGECIKPDFSWKLDDGDSQIPNTKGTRNCDREGWPGHWILKFSTSFAPDIYSKGGAAVLQDPENALKLGYYVRVQCSITDNGSQQKPGIFLNENKVELFGLGEEIVAGITGSEAFGATDANTFVPAGMSAAPVAEPNAFAPQAAPVAAPHPDFLNGPGAGVTPPPARVMLPKANGVAYEEYTKLGWTDEQLVANGYMQA